jgi:hypothetical protein
MRETVKQTGPSAERLKELALELAAIEAWDHMMFDVSDEVVKAGVELRWLRRLEILEELRALAGSAWPLSITGQC